MMSHIISAMCSILFWHFLYKWYTSIALVNFMIFTNGRRKKSEKMAESFWNYLFCAWTIPFCYFYFDYNIGYYFKGYSIKNLTPFSGDIIDFVDILLNKCFCEERFFLCLFFGYYSYRAYILFYVNEYLKTFMILGYCFYYRIVFSRGLNYGFLSLLLFNLISFFAEISDNFRNIFHIWFSNKTLNYLSFSMMIVNLLILIGLYTCGDFNEYSYMKQFDTPEEVFTEFFKMGVVVWTVLFIDFLYSLKNWEVHEPEFVQPLDLQSVERRISRNEERPSLTMEEKKRENVKCVYQTIRCYMRIKRKLKAVRKKLEEKKKSDDTKSSQIIEEYYGNTSPHIEETVKSSVVSNTDIEVTEK